MIIVDNALKARREQGKSIRIAILGAGFYVAGAHEPNREQRPRHAQWLPMYTAV